MSAVKIHEKGIFAASASAFFLGLAPVFGKQAIQFGFSPLAVVAIRTSLACLLLFAFLLLFKRQYFYIYPLGLAGCLVAGVINGVGSILYYSALARLDAGIGQLLYSFYPLFMVFWLLLDRQSVSRVTLFRLALVFPGVFLLINNARQGVDYVGAIFMLVAAALYALHLLINQRVLYEIPAPTVTFYTLVAMSVTVVIAFLLINPTLPDPGVPWWPLLILALITFFSRITLFLGVKHLGGMQTTLLGLGELLVTVIVAQFYLGEHLTLVQWGGVLLICFNLVLVIFDKPTSTKRSGKGFLYWLNPPLVNPTDSPFQE
jgi:drug/metabolite transporter (DMT)-like permease